MFNPHASPSAALQKTAALRTPALRIHRPPMCKGRLPDLENNVLTLVSQERALADKAGSAPAIAVLFNENSLVHRFNINSSEVMLAVEQISRKLPADMQFLVAFSIMEQADQFGIWNVPSNTGYLFSSNYTQHAAKRALTNGDVNELSNTSNTCHKASWNSRARRLEDRRVPFPTIQLDGFSVEHRVCADVHRPPLSRSTNTITLVSAWNLPSKYLKCISNIRPLIVINDCCAFKSSPNVLGGNKTVEVFKENGKYSYQEKVFELVH